MGMSQKSPHDQKPVEQIDYAVFKAIADFTYDWESWLQSDGKLLWVNAAVERITGYSLQECLAMQDYPLPLVVPRDRHKIADVMRDAISGGSGNDVEFQVAHREGPERWAAPLPAHPRAGATDLPGGRLGKVTHNYCRALIP